jgi:sialate O-acetylesterase
MTRRHATLCCLATVALFALPAAAELKLPAIFSDHMVLQRDIAVPVWGTSQPGDTVTVTFAGQTKTAKAAKDGTWRVALDPLKASTKPQALAVQSTIDNRKSTIQDVLVGEVWLCSGQSNMAMAVGRAVNAKAESAAAKLPLIRHIKVARAGGGGKGKKGKKGPTAAPKDIRGAWAVCSPQTAGGFSATAFFFGRELHKELKVPVGLINSSVGGTPIEQWTGPDNAGGLYQSMIAPLVPYAIRGAIWYQGERNAKSNATAYAERLPGLIRGWRKVWGQGEFPFYYVQLPNFKTPQSKPVEDDGWVLVQEAMLKTLAVPNTGMAVTIDVGDAKNIHPTNKQAVGKRLALWALGKTYEKDIVCCGPIYKSAARKGSTIVITFDHVGGGLVAKGGALKGFAIAGADKKFIWADAKIDGETIVVSSPKIKTPAAVRYAWAPNPKCNLYNKAGLPASPFRTDRD